MKRKKIKGATLMISLVMLLLLTLLGVVAMQSGVFQEKMSTYNRDTIFAFQASESALRAGEQWILSLPTVPVTTNDCSGGVPCVMQQDPTRYPENNSAAWWTANGQPVNTASATVTTAPMYVVEFSKFVPDDKTVGFGYNQPGLYYYRITARGSGASNTAVTILQSTIARRF